MVYPEALQLLFVVLVQIETEALKVNVLKQIETLLTPANMDKMLDYNVFLWVFEYLSASDKSSGESGPAEPEETKLPPDPSASSTMEILKKKSSDSALSHESGSTGFKRVEPSKSTEWLYRILTVVAMHDLAKSKGSRFLSLLRKVPSLETFQVELLKKVIEFVLKTPKLRKEDSHLLKNLQQVFSNIDQLFPFNASVLLRIMKLINVLASKNSMEVRNMMKSC